MSETLRNVLLERAETIGWLIVSWEVLYEAFPKRHRYDEPVVEQAEAWFRERRCSMTLVNKQRQTYRIGFQR
jgi:hypothetical protein